MEHQPVDPDLQHELIDNVVESAALLAAVHHRLLKQIAAANDSGQWVRDAAATPAAWLVAHLGVSPQTARAWVDVADRLEELPTTGLAFSEGRLSFDKVRLLTRYSTPDEDQFLASEAEMKSVTQLRSSLGRRRERIHPADTEKAYRDRYLRYWWDEENRLLRLSGELPDHDGAVVVKALDRLVYKSPFDHPEPFDARRADALVQLASQSLGADADPDRACVVVHIDSDRVGDELAAAEVEDGPFVPTRTLLRWACDCRHEVIVEKDGRPIGIGRASRRIPGWLMRQLRKRDRGCRFPGCERTRWVHGHHLVHWLFGGNTDLDNLILLCPYHHRLVHEHGWRISGDPNNTVTWIDAFGEPYHPAPPQLDPEIRDRLLAYAAEHVWTPVRGTARDDTS